MRHSLIQSSIHRFDVGGPDLPVLRRRSEFPFLDYGLRSHKGKATVAYWLVAHSYPGNVSHRCRQPRIQEHLHHASSPGRYSFWPAKPLSWKAGMTDTLDGLPVKHSIMAITDADYFDWQILPEAPNSPIFRPRDFGELALGARGGNPTNIVVERKGESGDGAPKQWTRIAKLPNTRDRVERFTS